MIDELKNKGTAEREKHLYEMIKSAVEFRKQVKDTEYVKNRAYYEGMMWKLTQINSDSPFYIQSDINHLANAIDTRVGSLMATDYLGDLLPKSPDDVEKIETLSVLYKNEWELLDIDEKIKQVLPDGALAGDGYVEFDYDPDIITGSTNNRNEGQIKVEYVHVAGIYIDPNADKFDDAMFTVRKYRKSLNWVKINKPEWFAKIKDKPDNGITDRHDASQIYVGRDYDTEQSKSVMISKLMVKNKVEKEVELGIDENTGEQIIDKVNGTKIMTYYFINEHLVEENDGYPFDEFPLIKFGWKDIPQMPYSIPLARGLTTPSMVANLIESAINTIAMHNAVPSYAVSDDSGLDIDEVSSLIPAMGVIYKVSGDPTKAIVPIKTAEINSDLIGYKDSFINTVKEYSGQSGAYIGNIGTAGSTASGTTDAISRATIIDNMPIANIQRFVEKIARMLIKYMLHYYKDRTIYVRKQSQIDGNQNNKYTFEEYRLESGLENINYDFSIDLFTKTTNDKNRKYNVMKEIYQLQNQYKDPNKFVMASDLIKAASLDNYNDIVARWQNLSEDALAEKASLIIELMQMGNAQTPDGQFIIQPEELQQGLLDILNDDGDLSLVQGIIDKYQKLQEQLVSDEQKQMDAEKQMMAKQAQVQ